MATVTLTPNPAKLGDNVLVTGADFLGAVEALVSVPDLGVQSEILTDIAGQFGTDDIADHALTTLTSTGVNVTAADTVTIGAVTYTFVVTPTTTANDVKIGVDAATTLANLKKAINLTGVSGTDYGSLTVIHPTASAGVLTATTLKVFAKTGGTAGNALASTKSAVTLSWPGATFTNGTPGTAASGVRALVLNFEDIGRYLVRVSDGTTTVDSYLVVSTA